MSVAPEKLIPELVEKLHEVRKERNFNARQWSDQKADMFNDYMRKAGLTACLVSVSGGVDSSVTLALMVHAQKRPNSPIKRVIGIAQPIKSTEKIWKRALLLKETYGVEIITVDQSELHTQLQSLCDTAVGVEGSAFSNGQLKSYMRTPVNFCIYVKMKHFILEICNLTSKDVAQLLSQNGTPCVVLGTGNYDEDGYLYYFCKAGDGVADIQLINDLHKSEVFGVGRELGVPEAILIAPPSADLWNDQTDEGELGFTYDFVELLTEFLRFSEEKQKEFLSTFSPAGKAQWDSLRAKAELIGEIDTRKTTP